MDDAIERDLEYFDRMTRGIKDAASQAADKLGDAVGDVVDAVEHLAGVVTDLFDRLREAEERLAKLEAASVVATAGEGEAGS